ncbi:hypothetical protein Taro_033366 [Colocasia esculenta]|uniref:Uncharacterized protein n=1 Tax=Colocasia esculenta TaxID=4460 RepID=A0A843W8U7_COLES|nr:hypothetical protein [Colocasia esculenta]
MLGACFGDSGLTWLYRCSVSFSTSAGRDSLHQEFVAGQSWWRRFVVPCVASSVWDVGCLCRETLVSRGCSGVS